MSTVAKFASIAFFGSVLFASSFAPVYALRAPESAEMQATRQQTVSAYVGNDQAAASDASILTPGEIRHVQWCAARYTLKYDAVSDTYAGAGGKRVQCRSPQ